MSARRIGCESRNNDSNVQYGYVCRLSALSVSRRLEACKHRIHRATRHARDGPHSVQPARPGQPPSTPDRCHLEEGGAHHTPRVPPREGRGFSPRVSSSRCMQVLTTAPRSQNLRALCMQVLTTAPGAPSELARSAARVELHELRAQASQRRLVEITRAEST